MNNILFLNFVKGNPNLLFSTGGVLILTDFSPSLINSKEVIF